MAKGAYFAVAQGFHMDPKAIRAGRDGRAVFLAALDLCTSEATDGLVSRADAAVLARWTDYPATTTVRLLHRLVEVGLMDAAEEGWRVRAFSSWQRSAAEVAQRRAAIRSRWQRDTGSGTGTGTENDTEGIRPVSDPYHHRTEDSTPDPRFARARRRARAREEGIAVSPSASTDDPFGDPGTRNWNPLVLEDYRDTHGGLEPLPQVLARWAQACSEAAQAGRSDEVIRGAMRGLMADPEGGPGLLAYRIDRPAQGAKRAAERMQERRAEAEWLAKHGGDAS